MLKTAFLFIPVFLVSSAMFRPAHRVAVQGIVIDKENSRPVSNSYLYIVRGEEEALTDSKGKFHIDTWQSLPVTLTIDHPKYKKTSITVNKAGANHVIRLEAK